MRCELTKSMARAISILGLCHYKLAVAFARSLNAGKRSYYTAPALDLSLSSYRVAAAACHHGRHRYHTYPGNCQDTRHPGKQPGDFYQQRSHGAFLSAVCSGSRK